MSIIQIPAWICKSCKSCPSFSVAQVSCSSVLFSVWPSSVSSDWVQTWTQTKLVWWALSCCWPDWSVTTSWSSWSRTRWDHKYVDSTVFHIGSTPVFTLFCWYHTDVWKSLNSSINPVLCRAINIYNIKLTTIRSFLWHKKTHDVKRGFISFTVWWGCYLLLRFFWCDSVGVVGASPEKAAAPKTCGTYTKEDNGRTIGRAGREEDGDRHKRVKKTGTGNAGIFWSFTMRDVRTPSLYWTAQNTRKLNYTIKQKQGKGFALMLS